ncbi:CAF1-domain-containing protein [Auriculariales sp. MPI-PUGE-AT-0066]|nr:CAF1-domain-containing protein [Auriculariales sp. MPI-PUGE-AT-0066]
MSRIRDVWATNLEQEMRVIRANIERYPYIAMDTEFPGVVARPVGQFRSPSDYHYQTMRCNVDLLKIIQIGITLADEKGEYPPEVCTWQFNFRFNLAEDMFAPESVDLLKTAGLDFQRHEEFGIDPVHFAELIITSGLVLTDDAKWISFHSGYDFGYLVKLLMDQNLPEQEDDFFQLLRLWFPGIYDIKYIIRATKVMTKASLQDVAEELGVQRIGPSHQAGSDSLLTAAAFFQMRKRFFEDGLDDDKLCGQLYGLGSTYNTNGALVGGIDAAQLQKSHTAGLTLAEREQPRHLGAILTPTLTAFGNTPIPTPFAPPALNMFARGMSMVPER